MAQCAGYISDMVWEIEVTDQFEEWWNGLSEDEQRRIRAAVALLEEQGPSLPRPLADTVRGSRPRGGNLRVFFAFDPRRAAILLIGGDKTNRWQAFYAEMIPRADALYDDHLAALRKEGVSPDG
jgi:hypothetical protein